MISLRLEVDDDPSWAEFTKEAIAERLSALGPVWVVEVTVDKPTQETMQGFPTSAPPRETRQAQSVAATAERLVKCARCGEIVREVECSDGHTRRCQPRARCCQIRGGAETVVTTDGLVVTTGSFDGRGLGPTKMGYELHICKTR